MGPTSGSEGCLFLHTPGLSEPADLRLPVGKSREWDTGQLAWTKPLPGGTSAQKAELSALTCALRPAAEVHVDTHPDSKRAFTSLHVRGALETEKGLIDSGGRDVKYGKEILELPEAAWAPETVAVARCRGRQKRRHRDCSGTQQSGSRSKARGLREGNRTSRARCSVAQLLSRVGSEALTA